MNKKYIIINLNQTVSRHQLDELKLEKKRLNIIIGVSGLLLLLLIWFNMINMDLSSIIETRQKKISTLTEKTEALNSNTEINISKKDVKALHSFDKKRIFWGKKLKVLSEITPQSVSITSIELTKRELNISAVTEIDDDLKEFDFVVEFISKLKNNTDFMNDFINIKFLNSTQESIKNKKVFSFSITAKLK